MSSLPSVNQAYVMVISDKNQKVVSQLISGVGLLGIAPTDTALYSKIGSQKEKGGYGSSYMTNAIYDHCKLKGHYIRDWFKLNGYPPGHLRHGEKKFMPNSNIGTRGYELRSKQ